MKPKTAIIALGVVFAAKFGFDSLPEAVVSWAFMRPAARLAAFYLGAELDLSTLTIASGGVELAVVRACSATNFCSMAFALLAVFLPVRPLACRLVVSLAAAWGGTIVVNSVRLVLLVFADRFFPSSQIPAVHMSIGIVVFLTVFSALWYTLVARKEQFNGTRAATE